MSDPDAKSMDDLQQEIASLKEMLASRDAQLSELYDLAYDPHLSPWKDAVDAAKGVSINLSMQLDSALNTIQANTAELLNFQSQLETDAIVKESLYQRIEALNKSMAIPAETFASFLEWFVDTHTPKDMKYRPAFSPEVLFEKESGNWHTAEAERRLSIWLHALVARVVESAQENLLTKFKVKSMFKNPTFHSIQQSARSSLEGYYDPMTGLSYEPDGE